ncbi:MAG: VOC family protein, partial [Candidatus Scalindua sp.]
MLNKINHINIVVSDLDKAKSFFVQLGFTVGDESELSGEWIS